MVSGGKITHKLIHGVNKKIMTRIIRLNKEEETGGWRSLHKEQLQHTSAG